MANTEGMPDEFVESLMTSSSSSSSPIATSGGKPGKKNRLQERMEMPMTGGKPAAKVIRASGNNKGRINSSASSTRPQDQQEQQQTSNSTFSMPLVGKVVEHAPSTATTARNRAKNTSAAKGKLSRFAQQQQQNAVNGFPSVHVPLGTFVQNRQPKPSTTPLVITAIAAASKLAPIHPKQQPEQSGAESMLAQMTSEEIREKQKELQAALSPDMVAFLKKRGSNKQNPQKQQQNVQSTTAVPQKSIESPSQPKDDFKEKERLANIVSKVQTYQDLDAAYRAEMKEAHPLEQTPSDGDETSRNAPSFQLACDLLRSTAPRQTLWAARVVCKTLQGYVQCQRGPSSPPPKRDWPIVLPVSLRCLLDQPLPSTTGYHAVLHTYVLQSLYSLMLLNALPDHVVYVTTASSMDANHCYQAYFMDDAVPTPAAESAYPSTTPVQPLTTVDNNKQGAAAYSTSSSSTSAQSDGADFEKDPMWTLLSKMRVLPRLAQLLSYDEQLPREAWISACGILCLLSQRSPGAATAIVHHATIVPRLVQRMRLKQEHQQQEEPPQDIHMEGEVAFAVMQLFCTLARQSRVAAQALPVEDVLPPLLAMNDVSKSNTPLDLRLQQMALVLWRTLLRYGLGLPALSTMMNLSAKHLALPDNSKQHQHSLRIEFVSAFAQVLDCAKLVRAKTSPKNNAGTTVIPDNAIQILSMASTYLSSTRRQVLISLRTGNESNDNGNCMDVSFRHRWNASKLRFLSGCWNLSFDVSSAANEEIKIEELSMEDELTCLEALDVWADPDGDVEQAWRQIYTLSSSNSTREGTTSTAEPTEYESEASACAFLESFVSIVLTLDKFSSHPENRMVRELAKSVVKHSTQRILEGMKEATKTGDAPEKSSEFDKMPLARRGWINQCHFAIAKLLFHAMSTNLLIESSDVRLVRELVFSLVGRLERGDEAVAAVLFSQDVIFQPNRNPLHEVEDPTDTSSPLSSMFLGELCGSDRARKQIDQSFKLNHGFGITSDGFGPFALDSLLSDADQPGPRSSDSSSELVLPVGKFWLWQTLSGAIRMKDEVVTKGTDEAVNVVSAVSGLLLELEDSCSGYASRIPVGAKLYYLTNVCLHPETVLRNDRVLDTAEAVLDRYVDQLEQASVFEFSQACLQHTQPAKITKSSSTGNDGEEEVELEEKDKKLFELFNPSQTTNIALSKEEMRSLGAFIEDLSTAYNDYGAQYDFFTKCMRLFLLPVFPSPIRRRTLRELRDILHLFTLPREMEHASEMSALLGKSVIGGLPKQDGSPRDPSDILDTVVDTVVHSSATRALDGYILNYSVALLARNLAASLSDEETGLEASKQRLMRLDPYTFTLVCETATKFLAGGGTKESLVDATIGVVFAYGSTETQKGSVSKVEESDLEERLKAVKRALHK